MLTSSVADDLILTEHENVGFRSSTQPT